MQKEPTKKRKKKPRRPHDPVYRRVFTHARMIEELLRRFLAGPWTAKLDFSTLELVPTHYVSRFLEPRQSDIIWRVRYGPGENEWFFVYVLMELQSSVQRFMALRLWVYVALLYQFLLNVSEINVSEITQPTDYKRLTSPDRVIGSGSRFLRRFSSSAHA